MICRLFYLCSGVHLQAQLPVASASLLSEALAEIKSAVQLNGIGINSAHTSSAVSCSTCIVGKSDIMQTAAHTSLSFARSLQID
jgi:hypothetical protein